MMSLLKASTLAFCFLLLLASPSAWAFCNPNPSTGVACLGAADSTCTTLGNTTMDGNRENIIACLGTPAGSNCAAGQCKWKAMTTTTTTPAPSTYGGFGGIYVSSFYCRVANPFTGGCSCPSGYRARQFWGSPANDIYFCYSL